MLTGDRPADTVRPTETASPEEKHRWVCVEEFVPEPGTIMLLGSGLVDLGAYATLRLLSGQALRWRTIEEAVNR